MENKTNGAVMRYVNHTGILKLVMKKKYLAIQSLAYLTIWLATQETKLSTQEKLVLDLVGLRPQANIEKSGKK